MPGPINPLGLGQRMFGNASRQIPLRYDNGPVVKRPAGAQPNPSAFQFDLGNDVVINGRAYAPPAQPAALPPGAPIPKDPYPSAPLPLPPGVDRSNDVLPFHAVPPHVQQAIVASLAEQLRTLREKNQAILGMKGGMGGTPSPSPSGAPVAPGAVAPTTNVAPTYSGTYYDQRGDWLLIPSLGSIPGREGQSPAALVWYNSKTGETSYQDPVSQHPPMQMKSKSQMF